MIEKYRDQHFGNYRLIRLLGQGGFADVYLGKHIHISREAALKFLNMRLRGNDIKQFRDEADIIAHLKHPHIVSLLDFGVENDTPFLVMEYAPNGSLRKKHPKGEQVSLATVVSYVKQAAQALQYAHDNKVIHRDVKPDNLLLDEHNKVLLSDFGIATVRATTTTFTIQQDNKNAGTLPYMAPEQFQGHPHFASDQYALALIAYELLCGELPFDGANHYLQWSNLHQNVEPPLLRDKVPMLPQEVEQVVLKALSKKLADRFTRINDFATHLEQAAIGKPVPPHGTSVRSTNRLNPSPVGKRISIPSHTPPNLIEQLIQEAIQAETHGEPATAYYLYREIVNTADAPSHYRKVAQDEMEKLRPQIVPFIRKQAAIIRQRASKAVLQGHWQDEIYAWEELKMLNLSEQEIGSPLTLGRLNYNIKERIEERIRIATQNEQWAGMYTRAEQLIREQDAATARELLNKIWDNAPYYGDPAGLAQFLGLLPPMNYEQALDEEERRKAEAARLAAKEQARKQALEEQARKQERKKNIIAILLTIISIFSSIVAVIISANIIYTPQIFRIMAIIIGLILGIWLTIVSLKEGASIDILASAALYSSLTTMSLRIVLPTLLIQPIFVAILTAVASIPLAEEKALVLWLTLCRVILLELLIVFLLAFIAILFIEIDFSTALKFSVIIVEIATTIATAVVVAVTTVAIIKDSK